MIFKRLWCRIAGHRHCRVITDVRIREASPFGLWGEIRGSRYDCLRCGERGVTIRARF